MKLKLIKGCGSETQITKEAKSVQKIESEEDARDEPLEAEDKDVPLPLVTNVNNSLHFFAMLKFRSTINKDTTLMDCIPADISFSE